MAIHAMRVVVVSAGGLGNVHSVLRAIDRAAKQSATLVSDPDDVRRADVVVVPGQGTFGAFSKAMEGGLGDALVERVRADRPYLGICLGLQILFEESDEAPGERGLGVVSGRVDRLVAEPLPHIGWNEVTPSASASLIKKPTHFYFAHSFACSPVDPSIVTATTEYDGRRFTSAVGFGAVAGVQFHPEKSQQAGLDLLERFFANIRGKPA